MKWLTHKNDSAFRPHRDAKGRILKVPLLQDSYRFKGLYRIRRSLCQRCEQVLAEATQALEKALARRDQVREAVGVQKMRLEAALVEHRNITVASIDSIQRRESFTRRMRNDLFSLQKPLEEAEQTLQHHMRHVEAARARLEQAESDLKIVEKNLESWTAEKRQSELKRAEQELEELAALKIATRDVGG